MKKREREREREREEGGYEKKGDRGNGEDRLRTCTSWIKATDCRKVGSFSTASGSDRDRDGAAGGIAKAIADGGEKEGKRVGPGKCTGDKRWNPKKKPRGRVCVCGRGKNSAKPRNPEMDGCFTERVGVSPVLSVERSLCGNANKKPPDGTARMINPRRWRWRRRRGNVTAKRKLI